jgi:hypothetical protein
METIVLVYSTSEPFGVRCLGHDVCSTGLITVDLVAGIIGLTVASMRLLNTQITVCLTVSETFRASFQI